MNTKNLLWTVFGIAILGVGIGASFILFAEKLSTVTLDINPSIELVVTKKEKIKSVRALNDDASSIVSSDLNEMPLRDAMNEIAKRIVNNGFVEDDKVIVLLTIDGKLSSAVMQNDIRKAFEAMNVESEIYIPTITEEAIAKAAELNITPAKATYLLEIINKNSELDIADLALRSTSELKEIIETGLYCDEEYTLKEGKCYKVAKSEEPVSGKVCPEGYEEKDKKCYKTAEWTEEKYCDNGQRLTGETCTGEVTTDAKVNCETGTFNSKTNKCEVLTYTDAGTKSCRENDDILLENGKCAQHHNPAHMNPDEVVDPNEECCCGDTYTNGWCYNLSGNYDASITCSSGSSYYETGEKGKGCYSKTSSDPTYYCDGNGVLSGKKCVDNSGTTPKVKKTCPADYKLLDERICLSTNETTDYIEGLSCSNKSAILKDDKCIIYEIIDAKSKTEEVTE